MALKRLTAVWCLLVAGLVLFTGAAATPPGNSAPSLENGPVDVFTNVSRVVAVGDVHGDVGAFTDVLKLAGLINAEGRWIGGKTHLVQTGDVPDRADDTRKVFDLLMRLEVEAKKEGGQVHSLIGNHEVMNMLGDLRHITAGELASYADLSPVPDPAGMPRGTHGHTAAFAPDGRYGRWLRSHPAVIRIDDTLFMHGGLSPEVPFNTLREVNRWVRQDLFAGNPRGGGVAENGPLWFRGYALDPEERWSTGLEAVLKRHDARRMVMGHTVTQSGKIEQRFGGRTLFIDTGLSTRYGRNLAALEIRGEQLTALYRGYKIKLTPPTGSTPPVR